VSQTTASCHDDILLTHLIRRSASDTQSVRALAPSSSRRMPLDRLHRCSNSYCSAHGPSRNLSAEGDADCRGGGAAIGAMALKSPRRRRKEGK
jgi:hypothetical protein